MDVLIRFGFSIEDIKNMMDTNIYIDNMDEENIKLLIGALQDVGCSLEEIKNILLANPFYLNRTYTDVLELIKELRKIDFSNLCIIFDSNPFLLNLDSLDIRNVIEDKIRHGYHDDEIRNYIDYELM